MSDAKTVDSIFCFSLPGGHMSYIATLVASMIGQIKLNESFITKSGSAHGANGYFPTELAIGNDPTTSKPIPLTMDHWKKWYNDILETNKHRPVVIKDSWVKFGAKNWSTAIKHTSSAVFISEPQSLIDWYYCWFNMVDKIPRHVYKTLMHKSPMHPKLWYKLNKKNRMKALTKAMPIYRTDDYLSSYLINEFECAFSTTMVLDPYFPSWLYSQLKQIIPDTDMQFFTWEYHNTFVAKQANNYLLAKKLADGYRWAPRGPWDTILFDWIDHKGAEILFT